MADTTRGLTDLRAMDQDLQLYRLWPMERLPFPAAFSIS